MDKINITIGRKIKQVREQKKLSLDQVSKLTDVSKGMLSKIENGNSSPTVSVLWKIATGLNVAFSYFVEDEEESLTVVRKNQQRIINEDDGEMRVFPLFTYDETRRFEVFIIELEPMSTHYSSAHRDNVEEYIIANDAMEVLIGKDRIQLRQGDAIRYIADQKHAYVNNNEHSISFQHIVFYHR